MRQSSTRAKRSFFSLSSGDGIALLFTLNPGELNEIRITNVANERFADMDMDDDAAMGITFQNKRYIYLPLSASLPSDTDDSIPSVQIRIHDVRRKLLPMMRTSTSAIIVDMAAVLIGPAGGIGTETRIEALSIEAEYKNLKFSQFQYDSSGITCTLSYDSDLTEPIPCHSFTPPYFPGAF